MFDAAALVLEEIAPEDMTRNEVLGARVNLYMAAKMGYGRSGCEPTGKIDPQTAGWWSVLPMRSGALKALRRRRTFC